METTYIKLDRSLLNHRYFHEPRILQVWIWCLMKATHTPHRQLVGLQTVELEVGEFVTGRASMAKELRIPASTAYRYLRLIQSDSKVSIKVSSRYSIVKVIDFATYQVHGYKRGQVFEQQMDSKWTDRGAIVDTNKKGKEGRACKEGVLKSLSPDSLRLSGTMGELVLRNNPRHRELSNGKGEATVARWAIDIDKMIRIDHRDPSEVEQVIRWCQDDPFWSKNILSGATLRKQYDRLILKVNEDKDKFKVRW